MTKQSTVKQTYFIVKVKENGAPSPEQYLKYDGYINNYIWTPDHAHASQFNEQADAERVAHFYQEIAVSRGFTDKFTYSLQKEDLSTTEIPLEKRDYLDGHGAEVEETD